MTNRPLHPHARRVARVLALVPALLVTSTAGAALADTPETWESTPHVSPLHVILVLGAIPLALFVVITLLVYLPSMSKGEKYKPGEAWRGEAEWFGGPSGGLEAADLSERPALTEGQSGSGVGGTSGRW